MTAVASVYIVSFPNLYVHHNSLVPPALYKYLSSMFSLQETACVLSIQTRFDFSTWFDGCDSVSVSPSEQQELGNLYQ